MADNPNGAAKDPLSSGSARSALITALGDLVEPCGDQPVRTAALVYVLKALGFSEHAARQAIARTGAAGLIDAERDGRETRWRLTDKAHRLFTEGDSRVFSTDVDITRWDGRWLVVNVPIPESLRSTRKRLYAALQWAGLGNPAPGLWVTPHVNRAAEVHKTIESLGLERYAVAFVGGLSVPGISEADLVARSWDLAAAEQAYDELCKRYDGRRFEGVDDQLVAHLQLADALRHMAYIDPRLPEVLLPDWPGLRYAKRLTALRAEWTPAAHQRWREIAAG
ncbi:phenylacetic acid degradation protein PaaX [Gordonia sp. TBRC 11910]|uniref:Phenylacetic acid degradation protein PaaX n=1 Tax=Gordonia asplenii TaxID=2725283 RepID=A0A848L0X6_9ACTN|nr:PaaX family transcriptional regulator C-terminal domain-containing protein [Gordonia asplenii]NMO02283.1 phenylacetic acid degradation protein PaaX [Gordonia asplenii]